MILYFLLLKVTTEAILSISFYPKALFILIYTLAYNTTCSLIGQFGKKPMGYCAGKLPLRFPIWQDYYE